MAARVLKGYTLIFAIVVIIVITSFALLFLSYFRINYFILNRAERSAKARLYCYEGLNLINSSFGKNEHEIIFPDGIHLALAQKQWGLFGLYYSIVKSSKDTLFSKMALIGYQQDTSTDLSLYIRKASTVLTAGDSVSVSGTCYVPLGIINSNNATFKNNLRNGQVLPSVDTIVQLNEIDSTVQWIESFKVQDEGTLVVRDSMSVSFKDTTMYLNSDSVVVAGPLSGNIIITANNVTIQPGTSIKNIIIIARSVTFPDDFTGTVQVFASRSILIGNNASFRYPSVLALMPEATTGPLNFADNYFITASGPMRIAGEIYAYAFSYSTSRNMFVSLAPGTDILGSVFSTGTLSWCGNCKGSIICDKLLNRNKSNSLTANYIQNSSLDTIPRIFSYSGLYPYRGQKKVVTWVN